MVSRKLWWITFTSIRFDSVFVLGLIPPRTAHADYINSFKKHVCSRMTVTLLLNMSRLCDVFVVCRCGTGATSVARTTTSGVWIRRVRRRLNCAATPGAVTLAAATARSVHVAAVVCTCTRLNGLEHTVGVL